MPFWSGNTLSQRLPDLVTQFDGDRIDCAAYTLRMGGQYYLSASDDISASNKIEQLNEGESLAIPSGQFAFLLSEETVEVPHQAIAFISMKMELKCRGLVNVSGFHVDPGFKGPLKFAVFNAGPSTICIKRGDDCFLIWYADLDPQAGKDFAKGDKDNARYARGIVGRDVSAISGAVKTLNVLASKVDDLEKTQAWMKVALFALGFVATLVIVTSTFLSQEGLKSFFRQAAGWLHWAQ